jgi:uncharacterized protein YyaL (SSP411 family)
MNRLATESSLYLRQHANNPVDWHPWGDEAIALARQLDRPIFLSIGYSACHWCHVMEHESFEDEATAKFLNEHFISIKVDREERPDVDHLYMTSLQLMTREGGGWPLSVWLTPELRPFYAGTYFPPDDRYAPQRPSFRRLLAAIAEAWRNQRDEIAERSTAVADHLKQMEESAPAAPSALGPDLLTSAERALRQGFDPVNGGFGSAPKFPHALELRLLLRIAKKGVGSLFRPASDENEAKRTPDPFFLVRMSLDKMAAGGIYDQIGGGFHRYSTDARWLVPHFEKMLYDNALLVAAYVDAWQATGEPEYRRIAGEALDYILREMTSPAGAFYSTQDADSEGEEGKFYVWSRAEIEAVLGAEEAQLFNYVYGVTDAGNFEGHNILHRAKTWEQLAKLLQQPADGIRAGVKTAAAKLYDVRSRRVWPGRDEKILTSWNGLMIAAFARAGSAFDEPRYVAAAAQAADFLLTQMQAADGSLFRTCAVGAPPRLPGYLEDYACLSDALVELHQTTFEMRWLTAALQLAQQILTRFADPAGGFFSTSAEHRHLIARGKDRYDGSTPSGNSMAVTALVRLAKLTGRDELRLAAEQALRACSAMLSESPGGSAQTLSALDFHLGPVTEFVIVGPTDDPETQAALRAIRQRFLPNALVLFQDPATNMVDAELLPLLRGKSGGDRVTTYVCIGETCLPPLVGGDALEMWLTQADVG